jgi:phosphatidate cytidylyltransferase
MMAWEWARLVGALKTAVDSLFFAGTAVATVMLAGLVAPWSGIALLAGAIGLRIATRHRDDLPLWTYGGMAWVVLPPVGIVWLRSFADGLTLCLWVAALVWSVDIAAFAVGRTLGGPKLAPRISPNKTWSGLIGGVAAATLVGLLTGLIIGAPGLWARLALISGALAIVEQIGDIAESYAKRQFGVKDSGGLIPGHGGVLDRLDGMLAVVAVLVIIILFKGGSVIS